MRFLAACVLAVLLTLAAASAASANHTKTHTRCTALVTQINKIRTRTDLRILYALCIIGRERAKRFAAAGEAWHNVDYAIRRMREMGWSYGWGRDFCGIGEAIGWTTATGTPNYLAARFARLWHDSAAHWPILNSGTYQRAGGDMIRGGGRTYVAFYVVDTTC